MFVCHCGSNIAGVVNIERVKDQSETMPHVAYVGDFVFSCSAETQPVLMDQIRKHRLNRIVVAACSPKTHEPLFQNTMRQAGLNPYLLEMANIRNHCSWVHSRDPETATRKAAELIRAAVSRAAYLQPLHAGDYPVVPSGLVIGGGIAGMTAALTMADQGFAVKMVEKERQLGGFARQLTHTLEGDSPARLIRYLAERINSHPKITTFVHSRLAAHSGHVGAFEGVVENSDGRHAIRYGAVVVATGGQAYKPGEYFYGSDERVCTQVEFARRMADEPSWAANLRTVVMIQCVGSRNEEFAYCSRVCCSAAVKNSIALKEINPRIQIIVLYRDLRTFGFKELYYLKARKAGVLFFRFIPAESPELLHTDGQLRVHFTDRSTHQDFQVDPDLVVLSTGIRPGDGAGSIERLLKLPRSEEGFFLEAHVKLRPMEFATSGIYLAGLAHSPRFIKESVIMAKGAAQQAVKILCRKKMSTSAAVAVVDPDLCVGCLACVRCCPFDAPQINKEHVSEIPAADCRGCGICICECPARAITLLHSSDDQLNAKIDALLSPQ